MQGFRHTKAVTGDRSNEIPRPQEKERIQVTVEEETNSIVQNNEGRESGLFFLLS